MLKDLLRSCSAFLALSITATSPASAVELLGAYADPAGATRSVVVAPLETFDLYVVGTGLQSGLAIFEFGLSLPAEFTVISADTKCDCLGLGCCGTGTNYITNLGSCWVPGSVAQPGHFRLFTAAAHSEGSQQICVGPYAPVSSFDPPAPGYLTCSSIPAPLALSPAQGEASEGCAVVSMSAVRAGATSWSRIKASAPSENEL